MLRWPLATRVGFLFQLGVDPRIVKAALEKMNPTPRGLAPAVAAADALVNATNPAKVSQGRIVSDVSVKSGRERRARAHLTKLPMTELIQPAPQHGTMRSRSMFELCRPMPVLSGQLLTLA